MWTTLALAMVLGTAARQNDTLTLSNVRATYGPFGVERKTNKVLPGDVYYLEFDIEGLQVGADGTAFYSQEMKVKDSKDKVVFGDQSDQRAFLALGGKTVPGSAFLIVGIDQPAGDLSITIKVTDSSKKGNKASKSITRKLEVIEKSFGVVRVTTTVDENHNYLVPAGGVVGESRFINFMVVGFERDPAKKNQPSFEVEMRILDEKGKETLTDSPYTARNAEVAENAASVPIQFPLQLTRAGKFTVELRAQDKVGKKNHTFTFPLTVTDPRPAKTSEEK
jgi:hypothetical protein